MAGRDKSASTIIKEAFREGDVNKDGFISRSELQALFSLLGCEKDLQSLMDAADKNRDGRLCYDEFIDFVMSSEIRAPAETEVLIHDKIKQTEKVGMDWMARFSEFGANGSCIVSVEEFKNCLQRFGIDVSEAEAQYIFNDRDWTQDGKLNLHEFTGCVQGKQVRQKPKKKEAEPASSAAPNVRRVCVLGSGYTGLVFLEHFLHLHERRCEEAIASGATPEKLEIHMIDMGDAPGGMALGISSGSTHTNAGGWYAGVSHAAFLEWAESNGGMAKHDLLHAHSLVEGRSAAYTTDGFKSFALFEGDDISGLVGKMTGGSVTSARELTMEALKHLFEGSASRVAPELFSAAVRDTEWLKYLDIGGSLYAPVEMQMGKFMFQVASATHFLPTALPELAKRVVQRISEKYRDHDLIQVHFRFGLQVSGVISKRCSATTAHEWEVTARKVPGTAPACDPLLASEQEFVGLQGINLVVSCLPAAAWAGISVEVTDEDDSEGRLLSECTRILAQKVQYHRYHQWEIELSAPPTIDHLKIKHGKHHETGELAPLGEVIGQAAGNVGVLLLNGGLRDVLEREGPAGAEGEVSGFYLHLDGESGGNTEQSSVRRYKRRVGVLQNGYCDFFSDALYGSERGEAFYRRRIVDALHAMGLPGIQEVKCHHVYFYAGFLSAEARARIASEQGAAGFLCALPEMQNSLAHCHGYGKHMAKMAAQNCVRCDQ